MPSKRSPVVSEWDRLGPQKQMELLGVADAANAGRVPLLHIAWKSQVEDILRDGLIPGDGGFGRQSAEDAETRPRHRGRVSLTTEDRVFHWIDEMEANLEPPVRRDTLVVLSVLAAGYDVAPDQRSPGDFFVSRPISPERICLMRRRSRPPNVVPVAAPVVAPDARTVFDMAAAAVQGGSPSEISEEQPPVRKAPGKRGARR